MTSALSDFTLHIPEGINYECTGCGKCCSGWAVPMTESDHERIAAVDWSKKLDKYVGRSLFRPLKKHEMSGSPYTHAIKPGEDGRCPFLVDNLCFVHSQYGVAAKPSICQLFPYCFNETPSGVYATVSFVSMGAIYNSGKALAEQREFLQAKLGEFKKLFPNHQPNWSQLQLVVGEPLQWADYLTIERALLDLLKDKSKPIDWRFIEASSQIIAKVRSRAAQTKSATMPAQSEAPMANLTRLDRHLLVALHRVYFPNQSLGKGVGDFNLIAFLKQLLSNWLGSPLKFKLGDKSFTIDQLTSLAWPVDDQDIDDLLYRYFFSRIFGKFYFGAGFGQLSLVAGFHHLAFVLALIKLQARGLALSAGAPAVCLSDVVAAIRQIEKRLGEAILGGYAAPLLELLLYSPARLRRVLEFSH